MQKITLFKGKCFKMTLILNSKSYILTIDTGKEAYLCTPGVIHFPYLLLSQGIHLTSQCKM